MPLIAIVDECKTWLTERLADGPVDYEVLKPEAKQAGFSKTTLQRASMQLGIVKRKHLKFPGGYTTWSLSDEGI